jgi:transcriptional regulator with XRE-family HTH domain
MPFSIRPPTAGGFRIFLPKTILGRNIWSLREWWNWSRPRLALEAHVSQSLIRQIEYDKGDPKLSQLRALADALKVNVGDLLKPGTSLVRISELDRERIKKKVRHGKPDECWMWVGAKRTKYGLYQMDGERGLPHRYMYAMEKPLMENWDLDHTCNAPLCVNPNHLRVVTRGTNLWWRDRRRDSSKRRV